MYCGVFNSCCPFDPPVQPCAMPSGRWDAPGGGWPLHRASQTPPISEGASGAPAASNLLAWEHLRPACILWFSRLTDPGSTLSQSWQNDSQICWWVPLVRQLLEGHLLCLTKILVKHCTDECEMWNQPSSGPKMDRNSEAHQQNGCAPVSQGGQNGEDAFQGKNVDRGEGPIDWERSLRQQRADGFKKIWALNAAVQVYEHLVHESRLVAEVQNGLHGKSTVCGPFRSGLS